MTGQGSFSAAAAAGTQSAERAEFSPVCGSSDLSHLADTPVGQNRAVVPPMSDDEREQAAYRAGCAMQAWYSRYRETGDVQALDTAYHFLGVQKQLLAGRSAEYVAKLEKERGLA